MKFEKRETSSNLGQANDFFRLQPGESKVGVLRGEIFEFHIKWENGKSTQVTADNPEGKLRFRANIFTREGEALVPKIWEFGITIYNQLADIATEYDVTTTPVKISRQGSGTDTIYMVMPILKTPLTTSQLKQIESTSLHILGKAPKAKASEAYPPSWDEKEDGPEPEF